MIAVPRKYRNIEFIFLSLLGLIILAIFGFIIYIGIDVIRSLDQVTGLEAKSEWAMVALIGLLLALFYFGVFTFWQCHLWRGWLNRTKRKYLQLALVFVLSVLPGLNGITDFILRNIVGIEKPFTEPLTKSLVEILIFPITGGE